MARTSQRARASIDLRSFGAFIIIAPPPGVAPFSTTTRLITAACRARTGTRPPRYHRNWIDWSTLDDVSVVSDLGLSVAPSPRSRATSSRWWAGRGPTAVVAAVLGSLLSGQAAAPTPENDGILAAGLRTHIEFLASDALEGRGVGDAGNERAITYIAGVMAAAGLQPAGTDFRQPFPIASASLGRSGAVILTDAPTGRETRHAVGDDFYPLPISADATRGGDAIFAGYGISAPALGYDDYGGIDVAGRTVIILRHEPEERNPTSRFAGRELSDYATFASKVDAARARHAAALLIVPDGSHGEGPELSDVDRVWPPVPIGAERAFDLDDMTRSDMPVGMVSIRVVERLLATTGRERRTIDALRRDIDERLGAAGADGRVSTPATFALPGWRVDVRADVTRTRITTSNVLGIVPGGDERLAGELVVVGAHLDHDGVDASHRVYNGADDNASGTAALLEIARATASAVRHGSSPRRTMVFAAWNAEERGALGSRFYVANALARSLSVTAMLNMDMIGRSEEVRDPNETRFRGLRRSTAEENRDALHLIGYSLSPGLAATIAALNDQSLLRLRTEYDDHVQNLLRRSDHWSFLERGIPAIFFTTGLHPDYHRPSDDPEKIEYDKLERIARLVHRVAWHLANQEVPPQPVTAGSTRTP